MGVKNFFKNLLCGAAIGVGMIIPGVSGGTVAVLLNIYDRLISALGGLRKNFKSNLVFLAAVLLGAGLGFIAAYFLLKWALDNAPFPTVMLFAGLMAGSMPKLLKDSKAAGFSKINVLSVAIPFAAVLAVSLTGMFTAAGDADLSADMEVWGYFAVTGVAMLASCALVIPGVSGSMLLMILGYYAPVLGLISGLRVDFLHSFAVLALFAAGLIVGFFSIARLMKFLLERFPRGTRWAIFGFVLASVPAIFIVFDYSSAPLGWLHILSGCILCLLGAVAAFALTAYAESKLKSSDNLPEKH